ncbi:hypothetical protein NDU88_000830, partial [Pleurodeles waltl]
QWERESGSRSVCLVVCERVSLLPGVCLSICGSSIHLVVCGSSVCLVVCGS